MILWIAFAILAAFVIAAIARPLMAEKTEVESAREADLAVYRDQLSEIDADLDRGLISESEAKNARAELGRRVIGRAERDDANGPGASWLPAIAPDKMAYGVAGVIPLLALAVYVSVGSPWLPGMPLASRMQADASDSTVDQLIAKVEAQLRKTPEDGVGWDVLAPVYLRQRRFNDAAKAYAKAIRLLGETTKRLKGFGEATVLANNGIVTEASRRAYERVLSLQSGDREARFWIALSDEQEGKIEKARAGYQGLLKEAPENAPWRKVVESRLAQLPGSDGNQTSPQAKPSSGPTEKSSTEVAQTGAGQPSARPPGPTAADVAAAGQMSQVERQDFINSMVSRLAEKLAKNPKDFEGWLRLVRAYSVLGRSADAQRALEDARKSVGEDNTKRSQLDALASELGLKS